MTTAHPTRKSPVQEGLDLTLEIIIGGTDPAHYREGSDRLHELMSRFAVNQLRNDGWEQRMRTEQDDQDFVLTAENCTCEEAENTPLAEAYWAATSSYFRRVFQAAAAAA